LLTEQVERLQIGLYSLIPSAFIRSFSFNPLYQCGQQQLQDEEDLRLQLQLQRCEAAFWHKFNAVQLGLPVRATAMLLCMQSAPAKMQFNRKNGARTGNQPTAAKDQGLGQTNRVQMKLYQR